MIFFGSDSKVPPGKFIEGIACPSCENKEFIAHGILNYFHIYWVSTFLTSKEIRIQCTHCRKSLVDKEIPKAISNQVKKQLFTTRNILSRFVGSGVIACLILFAIFNGQRIDRNQAIYMEQPAINDIYLVNFAKLFNDTGQSYRYGSMKVRQFSETRLEFHVSYYAYDKLSGVEKDIREGKTDQSSYYRADKNFFLDRAALLTMKKDKAIISVERI